MKHPLSRLVSLILAGILLLSLLPTATAAPYATDISAALAEAVEAAHECPTLPPINMESEQPTTIPTVVPITPTPECPTLPPINMEAEQPTAIPTVVPITPTPECPTLPPINMESEQSTTIPTAVPITPTPECPTPPPVVYETEEPPVLPTAVPITPTPESTTPPPVVFETEKPPVLPTPTGVPADVLEDMESLCGHENFRGDYVVTLDVVAAWLDDDMTEPAYHIPAGAPLYLDSRNGHIVCVAFNCDGKYAVCYIDDVYLHGLTDAEIDAYFPGLPGDPDLGDDRPDIPVVDAEFTGKTRPTSGNVCHIPPLSQSDVINVTDFSAIESEHYYANNTDTTWVCTHPGAYCVSVRFDNRTEVENYFDAIVLYDGDDNQIGVYTDEDLSGRYILTEGDTIKIRLISDSSVTHFGFRVEEFDYLVDPQPIPAAYAVSSTRIRLEMPPLEHMTTGYEIYHATNPDGPYTHVRSYSCDTGEPVEVAATFGKTNYFKLQGFHMGSDIIYTGFSSYRSLFCLSTPTLYAPETVGENSLRISFKGVANATAYRIYLATTPDGFDYQDYITVAADASAATQTALIENLRPDTTYYVRMRAASLLNGVTYVGPYGSVRSVYVGLTVTGSAPTMGPATVISSTSLKITWAAMPNAIGYELYRSDAHDGEYTKIASVNALQYTDNSPLYGRVNYYKVRALYGSSVSPLSVYRSTLGLSTPGITTLQDSAAQEGITVNFNSVAIANGYYISRAADRNGPFERIGITENPSGTGGQSLAYHDYTAATDVPYFYRVQAYYDNPVNGTRYVGPLCVIKTHTQTVSYRAFLVVQNDYPADDVPSYRIDNDAMLYMMESMNGTPYQITVREDLTANEILSQAPATFAGASANDISLFFFSSHGSNNGYLSCFNNTWLTAESLRSALDSVPGKKIMVMCACYSGQLIGKDASDAWARNFNQSIVSAFAYRERPGTLAYQDYYVLTSANGHENSYSQIFVNNGVEKRKISVLARALCLGCGWDHYRASRCALHADTNGDGRITLHEAYTYSYSKAFSLLGSSVSQHIQVYPENCPLVIFSE